MRKMIFLLAVAHSVFSLAAEDKICRAWFDAGKLKPNSPNCEVSCVTLNVSMATFSCPKQCAELCGKVSEPPWLGKVAYYPGLTPQERKLVEKFPKEAIVVFLQKTKAETFALKTFHRDDQNDESDAVRHFVWAALLRKELGPRLAKKFLEAHEASANSGEKPSKKMDEVINQLGLRTAEALHQAGKLTDAEIERAALKALADKKLSVLTPKGGPK